LAIQLEEYEKTIKKENFDNNKFTLKYTNPDNLIGEPFENMNPQRVVIDEDNYCFSLDEMQKIKKHPYTGKEWNNLKLYSSEKENSFLEKIEELVTKYKKRN